MTRHFATRRELGVTLVALERFVARVDVGVVVELVVVPERLVTVFALERPRKRKQVQT